MTRLEELVQKGEIDHTRQQDRFNPMEHPNASVTIIGAGGIGSPTAILLSKLGIANLTLVDFDEVEAHNVPNQFYALHHVNESKVVALKAMCEAFGVSDVKTVVGRGEEATDDLRGIVVTGLDSMDARKAVWEKVKFNPEVELLVDARIGGQDINIYTFNPNDPDMVEYYENFALFDQSEAVEAPCTDRGIIDVSFQVASLITRTVRKYLVGQNVESTLTFNQDDVAVEKSSPAKVRTLEAIMQMEEK